MQAGALDQQITLQLPSVVRDSTFGQPVETYADVATVWANVQFRPVGTPEVVVDGQVQSAMRVSIRIRYYGSMDPRMRIKHGTRFYQVLDFFTHGRNEETRISAALWNDGSR